MISINHKGNFNKTDNFFDRSLKNKYLDIFKKYGEKGVSQLKNNTPKVTGTTSNSWGYKIIQSKNKVTIYWTNDNIVEDVPIAIIIQYGHATRDGGYIQGLDYINPAIEPIYNQIVKELWGEVIK